jgi:hypothetical protein
MVTARYQQHLKLLQWWYLLGPRSHSARYDQLGDLFKNFVGESSTTRRCEDSVLPIELTLGEALEGYHSAISTRRRVLREICKDSGAAERCLRVVTNTTAKQVHMGTCASPYVRLHRRSASRGVPLQWVVFPWEHSLHCSRESRDNMGRESNERTVAKHQCCG